MPTRLLPEVYNKLERFCCHFGEVMLSNKFAFFSVGPI